MISIQNIINELETIAPPVLQESYDNAGLITGIKTWRCTGVICTLDATEAVIKEAVENNCNLVVAHHPIIFTGLKKLSGNSYVEKAIIAALKNDVAIYAVHTNLDNVIDGVNDKIADALRLQNRKILLPKNDLLKKLFTYVPAADAEKVKDAIFKAGGGNIGNYSECSFSSNGFGTFKSGNKAQPYIGEKGECTVTEEIKLEIIFPAYLQQNVVTALLQSHPYEEVAYDIIALENSYTNAGSGLIGELEEEIDEIVLLEKIKTAFVLSFIKHTRLLQKKVKTVAICGGSGSFLMKNAIAAKADFYITADIKYHEFFDADDKLVVADIGHWESEQFTIDLLADVLQAKFPNFAVLKTKQRTNPVYYY